MMRLLPELTPENRAFWTGGANGTLLITHCNDCQAAIHPPEVICPVCLSTKIMPRAVSGAAVIYSYTVNYQVWRPDLVDPYIIVVADLDDAPGVRITAELVELAPDAVKIGQNIQVRFLQYEDVWIPQFTPATAVG